MLVELVMALGEARDGCRAASARKEENTMIKFDHSGTRQRNDIQ